MAADHSAIVICPDAQKAVVNKALARVFGDAPSANNLQVALCPLPGSPYAAATHWANHIYREQGQANALLNLVLGLLPNFSDGLTWADFGVTQLQVLTACAAISVNVSTENEPPANYLNALLAARGLQLQQFEI